MHTPSQSTAAFTDYRELRPPEPLAEYLVCLWTKTISASELPQRVLPDGCVDILLINDLPVVIGPWTEPFASDLAPGTEILGARLHPGAAPSLLGLPASELLNQSVTLRDFWSAREAAHFTSITREQSLPARIARLEAALLCRARSAPPIDQQSRAAIRWLARHPEGRVAQLGQWQGFSSRQVQRRFVAAVGYGPKLFQSVLRFQRLLHLAATTGVCRNLAELSAQADYADQPHMNREVHRFSGDSPSLLLQSPLCALRLSGLL